MPLSGVDLYGRLNDHITVSCLNWLLRWTIQLDATEEPAISSDTFDKFKSFISLENKHLLLSYHPNDFIQINVYLWWSRLIRDNQSDLPETMRLLSAIEETKEPRILFRAEVKPLSFLIRMLTCYRRRDQIVKDQREHHPLPSTQCSNIPYPHF